MSKIHYIPFLVLVFATAIVAQRPVILERPQVARSDFAENFVVGEVKGTVPNKAVYLAKPDYPREARWAGAEGIVRVDVEIDIEGNVSKVTPVSGDAVLVPIVIDAAKRSKFRVARNASGEPVAVTGTLAYEFEIRKSGWAAIGWGLSGLEILPAATLPVPAVRKAFGPDWQSERELLNKIDAIRKSTPEPQRPTLVRGTSTTVQPPAGPARQSISRGIVNLPAPPPAELKVAAAQLSTTLRSRLAGDVLAAWQFELGVGLRKAIDEHRNPYTTGQAPRTVKQLVESAPNTASAETLRHLREIVEIRGKGRRVSTLDDLSFPISAILSER